MKEHLIQLGEVLHINKENAGLWLQLILCIAAIFLICRKSIFSISTGKTTSKKK